MDNALKKLFEEMRAAVALGSEAEHEAAKLREATIANNRRMNEAKERVDLLERTLKNHVYNNMPVVQAKMIAHEEMSNKSISREETTRAYVDVALGNRTTTLGGTVNPNRSRIVIGNF